MDCGQNAGSSALGNVGGLRSFLTLGDLKLHLVAFLQAFVPLRTDRAVMYKNIRAIRAANEPVTFRVIEPLHGSFQAFHVPPAFRTPFTGGLRTCPQ